jgi:putative endonuclease
LDSSTTIVLGLKSEQLAVQLLEEQGYALIERNFRCRRGEIDIIACEGDVLCFVEVRSVNDARCGDPLETVGVRKQQKIIRAARYYLHSRGLADPLVRFDAVGIVYQPTFRIRLVRGAFEARSAW